MWTVTHMVNVVGGEALEGFCQIKIMSKGLNGWSLYGKSIFSPLLGSEEWDAIYLYIANNI